VATAGVPTRTSATSRNACEGWGTSSNARHRTAHRRTAGTGRHRPVYQRATPPSRRPTPRVGTQERRVRHRGRRRVRPLAAGHPLEHALLYDALAAGHRPRPLLAPVLVLPGGLLRALQQVRLAVSRRLPRPRLLVRRVRLDG